jgi:hypothetical protein
MPEETFSATAICSAHAKYALRRENVRCTEKFCAAHGKYALHREISCCTTKICFAQPIFDMREDFSACRRLKDEFRFRSPKAVKLNRNF